MPFLEESHCPSNYSFAFANFAKCCMYYHKKVDLALDWDCDGGELTSNTSANCCPNNEYVDCMGEQCLDSPTCEMHA